MKLLLHHEQSIDHSLLFRLAYAIVTFIVKSTPTLLDDRDIFPESQSEFTFQN